MAEEPRIQNDEFSLFQSNILKPSYSVAEFLSEFTKPCARFKSPLSFKDRAELAAARNIAKLNLFKGVSLIPPHTIPPNWQTLLNYLYKEGVLAAPRFYTRRHANDLPARYKAALKAKFDPTKSDGYDVTEGGMGYGMSSDQEEAYSKAVGELLERHFLSTYKRNSFIKASYNSLVKKGGRVLNLTNLNTFLPWQKELFDVFNWNFDTEFYWTTATELFSNAKAYVPAQLAYWGYVRGKENAEPYLLHSSTNGAAGHFTRIEAILAGIYETVQRDSFLMFWLNTISPPVLDIEPLLTGELAALTEDAKRYGFKLIFLDTTTDISIPSCICVLLDERGDESSISIGGGCGFDVVDNLRSSAYEAISVHNGILKDTDTQKYVLSKEYQPFTSKDISRDERLRMWQGTTMFQRFAFFIDGPNVALEDSRFWQMRMEFSSLEQEYAHVLDLFRHMGPGYEIYCHEIQHAVLKKIGYHILKIVIPQMLPLYLTEYLATLDSKRLREVPQKLGYSKTSLNPWPHPFP